MTEELIEQQGRAVLESDAVKALFPQSGTLRVIRIDNIAVAGETHMRFIRDEDEEIKARDLFNKADVIVVEFNPLTDNSGWSHYSPNKPFMEMAVDTANERGVEIVNMHELVSDRYGVWEKAGISVSREDYLFLRSVNAAYMSFNSPEDPEMFKDAMEKAIQKISDQLVRDEGLEEDQARVYARAATIIRVGATNNLIQQIYSKFDSIARDYVYADCAIGLRNANPDKSVVFVVGNDHAKSLSDSLSAGRVVIQDPDPDELDLAQGISEFVYKLGSQKTE
jgi:hypothetical protein